ncbi:MAG: DNA repair protein RecO [Acidobacteria bacterium]|nr:DNA repair protein RecO [Acidobacteriota bacterium]
MPLVESEAIILRSRAWGEADKLVSFLSRARGRLRGIAPSARRSRRRFGAALEPLSHVRLWFFEREGRELVRLSQSELIEGFWDARGDYQRSLALSQVAELAELLLPEREPSDKAFRLLLATLEGFKGAESIWLPLAYFQLWSVRLAGWLPGLQECGRCGKSLGDEPGYFSVDRGRAFCRGCRLPGMRTLGAASRRTVVEMLEKPLPKLSPEAWDRRRAAELGALLLDVIEYHAEHKLTTRELLDEKA